MNIGGWRITLSDMRSPSRLIAMIKLDGTGKTVSRTTTGGTTYKQSVSLLNICDRLLRLNTTFCGYMPEQCYSDPVQVVRKSGSKETNRIDYNLVVYRVQSHCAPIPRCWIRCASCHWCSKENWYSQAGKLNRIDPTWGELNSEVKLLLSTVECPLTLVG